MQDMSQVRKLVQAFRENHKALKDQGTAEAVIRQEYIDSLWKLLGWDVNNQAHRSLAEKDVVVEANVGTVEGREVHHRRPDYLFRIDGFPRFIVEAKSCAVDIATDKDAIFQAKTYAWSAQIPFAILTNFEQFRLFDATVKPDYDAAGVGAVADFDLRFEGYEQQWDVLEQTFGREAVAGGSLEKLLGKIKHVRAGRRIRGIDRMLLDLRGSEPVDRAFLAHIEDFRLRLARELYRENKTSFPEANTIHGAARLAEAAQRLVDRLVFIRVCEDRDIASYGELRDVVNGARERRTELYPELVREFRKFDERYNGYIFKAHFSEELTVPADSLVDFIRSLYPPDGPYRFDAIADDILGIIYERFLGSAITVTRGHVDAEPKPEVRHAGGVYYTPKFVVDTIVRRVVGPQIKGKSPIEILDVKILDPACGSGSFLIAALEYLYSHCLKCLEKDPKSAAVEVTTKRRKVKKKLGFQDEEGNWYLMPEFRGQILQSCIYGVDIDAQAVEVTIMSLYLKMLEGRLPKNWQRDFLEARLLPPLDNNIHCGNSLISQADFDRYWEKRFGNLFGGDPDVRFRINAFDWTSQTRGFGRIFEGQKGFDCVIGNPPYIRVQELNKWAPEECEFYRANYRSAAQGNYDIYVVFIEKALSLLSPHGLLGFICPHKFWQATYGENIREIIAAGRLLKSVIDFGTEQIFHGATTYTSIHVFQQMGKGELVDYARVEDLVDGEAQCRALDSGGTAPGVTAFKSPHPARGGERFVFVRAGRSVKALMETTNALPLGDVARLAQGIKTSADDVYVLQVIGTEPGILHVKSEHTGKIHEVEKAVTKPLVKSEHIRRFDLRDSDLALLFPYRIGRDSYGLIDAGAFRTHYPKAWKYLKEVEDRLRDRERGRMRTRDDWYAYIYPKNFLVLSQPKLLIPDMSDTMRVAFDSTGDRILSGGAAGGNAIVPNDKEAFQFLAGLLNSRLVELFIRENGTQFRGGWLNCEVRFIRDVPVAQLVTVQAKNVGKKISERAATITRLKRDLPHLRTQREMEQAERQIESYERQIDELVCELYGLKEVPE